MPDTKSQIPFYMKYPEERQIGGFQGLGREGDGEQLFKGHSVSFWSDENVFELDG